ncbi:hypothetical protein [Deinococcus cellulosilyticus]|nr:hypothetical protein [Deinococcus cellulosilyticus]
MAMPLHLERSGVFEEALPGEQKEQIVDQQTKHNKGLEAFVLLLSAF